MGPFYSKPPLQWVWDDAADWRVRPRNKINTDDLFFPDGFLWGTATAAHQIEGGCTNNNWAAFESTRDDKNMPRIRDDERCGPAVDHWNRVDQDIGLMKQLGVNAYRFSVEWSKIEPSEGQFDTQALRHYRDEIDALKAAGIVPMITLHHFTEPTWFADKDGFERDANIAAFVRFAVRVFTEFQDVEYWCTINEPEVYVTGGWFSGMFPPGKKNPQLAGRVLANILEAHVQVYQALKQAAKRPQRIQIGIVKDIFQFEPNNRFNPFDIYVARLLERVFNECILNFFVTGRFVFSMPGTPTLVHMNPSAPRTNDFIGLNYYSHFYVKFRLNPAQPFDLLAREADLKTDMAFQSIYPEGLYRAVKQLSALFPAIPIIITENGIADEVDDRRALYIRRYLYALSRAIREGCNVRGYFYWSLLDNFEWVEGFSMKFGLFAVNRATQERTLRPGSQQFVSIVQRFSRP